MVYCAIVSEEKCGVDTLWQVRKLLVVDIIHYMIQDRILDLGYRSTSIGRAQKGISLLA